MNKWFKSLKNKITLSLAVLGLTTGAFVPYAENKNNITVKAESSSNDKIRAFLQLAKGKEMNDIESVDDLTDKDIEFLGVYLSNWFVPFSTDISKGSNTSSRTKDKEENKDKGDSELVASDKTEEVGERVDYANMYKAMEANTGFSEKVSKNLTNHILGNMTKGIELTMAVSKKKISDDNFSKTDMKVVKGIKVNSFVFYSTMIGGMAGKDGLADGIIEMCDLDNNSDQSLRLNPKDDTGYFDKGGASSKGPFCKEDIDFKSIINTYDLELLKEIRDNEYSYVYFYGSDIEKPVFDAALTKEVDLTASQMVFYECLMNTNRKNGSNIAFFDLDGVDIGNMKAIDFTGDNAQILLANGKQSYKSFAKMSMYGTTIKVDPFGNILSEGDKHTYVLVPACMNPYRWVNLATATESYTAGGDSAMVVNVPQLILYNNEKSMYSNLKEAGNSDLLKGLKALQKGIANTVKESISGTNKNEETKTDNNNKGGRPGNVSSMAADAVIMASASGVSLSSNTVLEPSNLKEYYANNNRLVNNKPFRQDTVLTTESKILSSWTSSQGYDYFINNEDNDLENKKIIEAILKIVCNSMEGLDLNTNNIEIDYTTGTWSLKTFSTDKVKKAKIRYLENALSNPQSWKEDATKSAQAGYEFLTKKSGVFGKSYLDKLQDSENVSFVAKLKNDLQGLDNSIKLQSDVQIAAGDGEKDTKKDEKDDKEDKKDSESEKKSSSNYELKNENPNNFTYVTMQVDFGQRSTTGTDPIRADNTYQRRAGAINNHKYRLVPTAIIRGDSDSALKSGWENWGSFFGAESKRATLYAITTWGAIATESCFNVVNVNDVGTNSRYNEVNFPVVYQWETGSNKDIYYDSNTQYNWLVNSVFLDTQGEHKDSDGNLYKIASYLGYDDSTFDSSASGTFDILSEDNLGEVSSNNLTEDTAYMIYSSYLFAAFGVGTEALGYEMSSGNFPALGDDPLADSLFDDDLDGNEMDNEIRNWIYYLLHPTKGIDYIRILVTNKINGLLCGFHDAMLGTTGTGSIAGTTRYKGYTGYTTCPEMQDTTATSALYSWYETLKPFIFILVIVVLVLGMFATGMTWQKVLICAVIFFVAIQMPPFLVDNSIAVTNKVSSELFSNRFIYWALMQHQIYLTDILEAADDSNSSYDQYLRTLYSNNSKATKTQGGNSITVRWQAVKKMASLQYGPNDLKIDEDLKNNGASSVLLNNWNMMAINNNKAESYTGNFEDTYIWRNYIDIGNNARSIFKGSLGYGYNVSGANQSGWSQGLVKSVSNIDTITNTGITGGYVNKGRLGSDQENQMYYRLPLCSDLVNNSFNDINKIGESESDSDLTSRYGISNDAFQFSLKQFNLGSGFAEAIESTRTKNADALGYDQDFNPSDYSDEEYVALAAYALMSESPFYYWSWYLYTVGLCTTADCKEHYKNLLLGSDNLAFFNATTGGNEQALKDFMDMRSFFHFILPYMHAGNEVVRKWDKTQGVFFYDGISSDPGHENDYTDPISKQKYWHNVNTRRLYNIYCPWADLMYDCDYAKEQQIEVQGTKLTVSNPLDPTTYPEDRPMIFSQAEQQNWGLNDSQLTTVERKIIEFEQKTREEMYNLLNYANFSDTVLNNAAAMVTLFSFNQVFSESNVFGESFVLYPQSFEIKDFSYDAYLRFILASNSVDSITGQMEDMQQAEYGDTLEEKGFYQRVVARSSIFTSLLLVLNAAVAQYCIPIAKLAFVVGIFLLMILEILVAIFRVTGSVNYVKRIVSTSIVPLLQFIGIMAVMNLLIAIFMGTSNTQVTGGLLPTIVFGSPELSLIVLLAVNGGVIYLLFRLLKKMYINIWQDGKKLMVTMKGLVLGGIAALGNKFGKGGAGRGGNSGTNQGTAGNGEGAGKGHHRDEVVVVDERKKKKEAKQYDNDLSDIENEDSEDDMDDFNSTSELDALCSDNND